MNLMQTLGKFLLFSVLFVIGLNMLLEPQSHQKQWARVLSQFYPGTVIPVIIQGSGALIMIFSMISLFFSRKESDFILVTLIALASVIVYNPGTLGATEEFKLSLSIISCLLMQ
jgi:hypothetical protein